jgi:hypothetical protein
LPHLHARCTAVGCRLRSRGAHAQTQQARRCSTNTNGVQRLRPAVRAATAAAPAPSFPHTRPHAHAHQPTRYHTLPAACFGAPCLLLAVLTHTDSATTTTATTTRAAASLTQCVGVVGVCARPQCRCHCVLVEFLEALPQGWQTAVHLLERSSRLVDTRGQA